MAKSILMVFTTVVEKFNAREELLKKFPDAKYSDFAVETPDTIYKFHVVNMDPIFSICRELDDLKITKVYDEIRMENVVKGIKTLYRNAVRICGLEAAKEVKIEPNIETVDASKTSFAKQENIENQPLNPNPINNAPENKTPDIK